MSRNDEHDYLWDGQGHDEDVEKLENLLGGLAHKPRPQPAPVRVRRRRWLAPVIGGGVLLAAAAVLLVLLRSTYKEPGRVGQVHHEGVTSRPAPPAPPAVETAWSVSPLSGAPACGGASCAGALKVGQWLETDASSSARVAVADIGFMTVAPATRVRLKDSSTHGHRLELERGTISAKVVAPPRLLVVETPTAQAVDLGCAYTLSVRPDGGSRLTVTSGWVALERAGGLTDYVPAGSIAETRPGKGAGTPWRTDAPAGLTSALEKLDFEGGGPPELEVILDQARPADTLTLWHLLSRVDEKARGRVYDRMVALAGRPPSGRDRVLALDPDALEAWRMALSIHW